MTKEKGYIGYIKYQGKLVEGGLLDARKSAEALLGFDQIVRYFVIKDRPDLKDLNFEIPVRIGNNSWEALIPDTIGELIRNAAILVATAYATTAAKKMAENDFDDLGIKNIFKRSLKSAQWMIEISKHLGTTTKRKFEKLRWLDKNENVLILNDRAEQLKVPTRELKIFSEIPHNIFSKNAALVEVERSLSLGVYENGKPEEVTIKEHEKGIFYKGEEEEVIFPELKHGQQVELEGYISRENKNSNNLGFEYRDHILNCFPAEGSIIRFKENIFSKVKIIGTVDRIDEFGQLEAKKPQIIIKEVIQLEINGHNQQLFK